MFTITWQAIGDALLDALYWFLEGLLGTYSAAIHFHTDVPWYQCLASQLIVLSVAIPLVILGERMRERKKRLERYKRGE